MLYPGASSVDEGSGPDLEELRSRAIADEPAVSLADCGEELRRVAELAAELLCAAEDAAD